MIRILTLLTFLALSTMQPAALRAQEAAPAGGPAEQAPEGDESTNDTRKDDPQPESTASRPAPAAARDRDPSEYQASEQISEDLSVSFPVDI